MARSSVMGTLEVELHHARGLHNICIYQKQDVYATLSIIHDGVQTTYRTDVVNQGGKDPVFNQKFRTRSVPSDSVLRCEVWMDSKAKDYLQDQQLGLVSVPLSSLAGKKKHCVEYRLSSTELFHSPAGTLSMTAEFIPQDGGASELAEENGSSTSDPSACSDGDGLSTPLKNGQFLDLSDAREVRLLVSEYIQSGDSKRDSSTGDGILTGPPYLEAESRTEGEGTRTTGLQVELPAGLHEEVEEASVVVESEQEAEVGVSGSKRSKHLEVTVSTTSSLLESSISNGVTPSSKPKEEVRSLSEELGKVTVPEPVTEPRIMQEEIVGMYMKSMQQFSEALAKMQLPVVDDNVVAQKPVESIDCPSGEPQDLKKTDSGSGTSNSGSEGKPSSRQQQSKVFYGSRAFF